MYDKIHYKKKKKKKTSGGVGTLSGPENMSRIKWYRKKIKLKDAPGRERGNSYKNYVLYDSGKCHSHGVMK